MPFTLDASASRFHIHLKAHALRLFFPVCARVSSKLPLARGDTRAGRTQLRRRGARLAARGHFGGNPAPRDYSGRNREYLSGASNDAVNAGLEDDVRRLVGRTRGTSRSDGTE